MEPSRLLASVTIKNRNEFNQLNKYWRETYGYGAAFSYDNSMHSLQLWNTFHVTHGAHDGPFYSNGEDWIADFAGDFEDYMDEQRGLEIEVGEFL